MCIAGSVGRGGRNDRADVRTVQLMLNMNHPQINGPLVPDGSCGPQTIALIEQYARGVVGCTDRAGQVTPLPMPGGSTLLALRGGMPPGFSLHKLEGMFVDASAATVAKFFGALLAGMTAGAVDTPLRQAHFLAQLGHESGQLRYTEELASGTAYEGRKNLGNTQPGDGVRFKGRGLIQLTGRANYTAFGKFMGQDFLTGDNPRKLSQDPALAVGVAVWFWNTHHMNAMADADDVLACTKCVNGGTRGLDDRTAMLARAKWFLMDPHPDPAAAELVGAIQAVAGTA